MTTPSTDPNIPADVTPVKAAKPGIPRALLLGGVVVGLAGVAGAAFYFLSPKQEAPEDNTPPPAPVAKVNKPAKTNPTAKPVTAATNPAVAAAKAQALAAMGNNGRASYQTSFDNVPVALGGTGLPVYPTPPKDNSSKPKPIVQGQLPNALRSDPFVSRLIVPILREYAYTLAVPIRLAPPAKPILPPVKDISPELRYGPLVFPGRVAGFLEFGGVSAILETGVGTGAFDIVQPGSTVSSGIPGVPPLTVESISNTELVLRSEDGRTAKVPLSGVPGGVSIPGSGAGLPGGGPGGPGGPAGFPGGPGGRGGRNGVE